MTTTIDLRGRHQLGVNGLSREEIVHLLDLAAELKAAKREGREEQRLAGRHIALILQTDCPRTRCACEVAAHDQGAAVSLIDPTGWRPGIAEAVKDIARVLGRMYDAVAFGGSDDSVAREFAQWAGVPVYNGLAAEWHASQILADFLTFEEHLDKPLDDVVFCYLGDARSGAAEAYLSGAGKLGMDVRIASPRALWPTPEVVDGARRVARKSGGRLTITEDVGAAVKSCDVLITRRWVPIGEPIETWRQRINLLLPYQVSRRTMALTGNPAVKFMHAGPAFHPAATALAGELLDGHGMDALAVTEEVFESSASLVFAEAENQMHMLKAVLVATLGD